MFLSERNMILTCQAFKCYDEGDMQLEIEITQNEFHKLIGESEFEGF